MLKLLRKTCHNNVQVLYIAFHPRVSQSYLEWLANLTLHLNAAEEELAQHTGPDIWCHRSGVWRCWYQSFYVFSSTFTQKIPTETDVLGAMSIIFWTITLVVVVKYMIIILMADDNGEGELSAPAPGQT